MFACMNITNILDYYFEYYNCFNFINYAYDPRFSIVSIIWSLKLTILLALGLVIPTWVSFQSFSRLQRYSLLPGPALRQISGFLLYFLQTTCCCTFQYLRLLLRTLPVQSYFLNCLLNVLEFCCFTCFVFEFDFSLFLHASSR